MEADGGFDAQGALPVTTRIVDAQVLLTAVTTETLSYSGTDRSTFITFPGGAVFDDTVVTYEETGEPDDLGDLRFAGRAFRLDAYQNNLLMQEFQLYAPLYITVTFSPADVAGIDLDRLTLLYRDGNEWQGAGIDCTVDRSAQQVQCTLTNPSLGQFALVASDADLRIYLPLVLNNLAPPE